MSAFIFILHTLDTFFCNTFVQIASFLYRHFLLILCEKRSSCGLDDVGCGWLGPSQEGKKKIKAASSYSESARTGEKILFHGTMLEGRKRRKHFMQPTVQATIYACTLLKNVGFSSCRSLSGFWVYIFLQPCVYFCNSGMTTSAFS